jgi:hypothetical protein
VAIGMAAADPSVPVCLADYNHHDS